MDHQFSHQQNEEVINAPGVVSFHPHSFLLYKYKNPHIVNFVDDSVIISPLGQMNHMDLYYYF